MVRSRHRRLMITGGQSLDEIIQQTNGWLVDWNHQETSGLVLGARNRAVALGRNVVINGAMEGTYDDESGGGGGTINVAPNWNEKNTNKTGPDTLDKEITIVHGGSASQYVDVTGANRGVEADHNVFFAGKGYSLSIWLFIVSGTVAIRHEFDGVLVSSSTTGSWIELIDTGTALTDGTLRILSSGGAAEFYVDDVSVNQTNIAASSSFPGSEELTNGTFAADTDWTKGDAAITIASGKATWSGVQAGNADLTQTVAPLVNGIRYKLYIVLSGVTAGTITPLYGSQSGAALSANGTYPLEEKTANGTAFVLRGDSSFAGSCEIVSVKPANPLNGDHSGVEVGVTGNGGGIQFAVRDDGGTTFTDIYSPEINSMFDPTKGALIAWAKVANAGVWTDAITRNIITLDADGSNNLLSIQKTGVVNEIKFNYFAGGTVESIVDTSLNGSLSLFMAAMTWNSSGNLTAYINGVMVGTPQAIAGTWVGNLLSTGTVVGAFSTVPNAVWHGDRAYVSLYDEVLTLPEIQAQYQAGM